MIYLFVQLQCNHWHSVFFIFEFVCAFSVLSLFYVLQISPAVFVDNS